MYVLIVDPDHQVVLEVDLQVEYFLNLLILDLQDKCYHLLNHRLLQKRYQEYLFFLPRNLLPRLKLVIKWITTNIEL